MLQELGYDKQPKYYETQVTYEGSKPVWHVQVYIFTPKPLRGVFEVEKIHAAKAPRHTFYVGSLMLPTKPAWSLIHATANSWTERNVLTLANDLVDLPTTMWSVYLIQGTSSSKSK
jgi:hypothetical protein